MKQLLLTICASCFFFSLFAQDELSGKEFSSYVFPAFIEGTVKQKSGEVNKAFLNYNSLTEEMIFEQSGQKMALDKIEEIDTVYIENKKFIPAGKVFYEVVTNTPVALFIQHKSDLIPPGSETGFGTSQTSAITNVNDLKNSGIAYKLKLPDDYKITLKKIYWLKKNNNYYLVKAIKNVLDLFPEKADAIKAYVKANKIDLKNSDDAMKLIVFCN
jgi:hypothetical protein